MTLEMIKNCQYLNLIIFLMLKIGYFRKHIRFGTHWIVKLNPWKALIYLRLHVLWKGPNCKCGHCLECKTFIV